MVKPLQGECSSGGRLDGPVGYEECSGDSYEYERVEEMLPGEIDIDARLHTIVSELGDRAIARDTVDDLNELADDPHKDGLVRWLQDGIDLEDRRYEIRSALRCLSRVISPRTYLEIGTRRGWSLVQVLRETPTCAAVSCDMWVTDYADAPNPGPAFVRDELARVCDGASEITFVSGNSHDVLPVLFGTARPDTDVPDTLDAARIAGGISDRFDLVTVDGDHSALGAWWDLCDVLPRVAVGGVVVFDDLLDWSDELLGSVPTSRYPVLHQRPALPHSLLEVWRHAEATFTDFHFVTALDFPEGAPPVGFAMRMREPVIT